MIQFWGLLLFLLLILSSYDYVVLLELMLILDGQMLLVVRFENGVLI